MKNGLQQYGLSKEEIAFIESIIRPMELDNIDFIVSWSYYLFLIRIDDLEERKFYEIEAINNNWSLNAFHN